MPIHFFDHFAFGCARLCLVFISVLIPGRMTCATDEPLVVKGLQNISQNHLPITRIPVGSPGDYKPCLARLANDDLLLIGFHTTGGVPNEYCFLYRSQDGGRSWSSRRHLDLVGREPYFSVTRDGTIFITTHVLTSAKDNRDGYVYSLLYRSVDAGATFDVTKIGHERVHGAQRDGRWPGRALVATGRNVLELDDGTLAFAVAAPHGAEFLWHSRDGGETWSDSRACTFHGVDMEAMTYPIFGEAVLYQAANGDLLSLCRVMLKYFPPIPGTTIPGQKTDQWERLVLYRSRDGGNSWRMEELGSWYGEMYPALLSLPDNEMLITFTVRAAVAPRQPHLGLRAVLGQRTDDGFYFDFDRDRIMLETRSDPNAISGGGFGNTVRLDDGTLVSCYSYRTSDNKLHVEVARWRIAP